MLQLITVLSVTALVAVDQLIKYFVLRFLEPVGSAPFIPYLVKLTYVENTGAAFGSFSKYTIVLSIFTAILLALCLYLLLSGKIQKKLPYAAFILITAGGLGNLIDRVFRGFVIDYFDFMFMRFAVFNFADSLVCIGAFLLILHLIIEAVQESRAEKAKKQAQVAEHTHETD